MGGKVGRMSQEHIIELAKAIESLRAALTEAVDKGRAQGMQFRIEPIELTLQAVVTTDVNGKVGWGALGVGGKYESASTQTLKLKLKPVWRLDDGSLVDDFTVADQSSTPQHFGPRPTSEEAQDADDEQNPDISGKPESW